MNTELQRTDALVLKSTNRSAADNAAEDKLCPEVPAVQGPRKYPEGWKVYPEAYERYYSRADIFSMGLHSKWQFIALKRVIYNAWMAGRRKEKK